MVLKQIKFDEDGSITEVPVTISQFDQEMNKRLQSMDTIKIPYVDPVVMDDGDLIATMQGGSKLYIKKPLPQPRGFFIHPHDQVGMDFETWGAEPLPVVGLYNYLHGEFTPLACALVWEDYKTMTEQILVFDFVCDDMAMPNFIQTIEQIRLNTAFAAHNASFERGVLETMGLNPFGYMMVDSAVISRCLGAGSHLEAAAPQLLGIDKMEVGKGLIQKFSIPNALFGFKPPTKEAVEDDPDWKLFLKYMVQDARASYRLSKLSPFIAQKEFDNELLTAKMNHVGWKVDLNAVKEMQIRYLLNLENELARFRRQYDPAGELNLGSTPQLQRWCKARGMHSTSFDELHVEKYLNAVTKKLADPTLLQNKIDDLRAIQVMLKTKKALGGSSLKKLQVILDTIGADGRLHDQYMHCGAGQSYRTSARGAQMQNLKRLKEIRDMDSLMLPGSTWDNEDLASNIRQVFTATEDDGSLIVGDLASIESRGLAYLAGESWKLDAYHNKQDLYKVLAAKIYFITDWHDVTKTQRQTGKVGELSCGYGAGGSAVQDFAKGMHIDMSLDDATDLVRNWRATNPHIVDFWDILDGMLKIAVSGQEIGRPLFNGGLGIRFRPDTTPISLQRQHPGARTVTMELLKDGEVYLQRTFQGCYLRGNNVCYYKPSENKNGQLWSGWYNHPKTKQKTFYNLYGGKLAGILTQSFCRELFFEVLLRVVRQTCSLCADVVGQFHDEIVLDYYPSKGHHTLGEMQAQLYDVMSHLPLFPDFPMGCEVKSDYRYTK